MSKPHHITIVDTAGAAPRMYDYATKRDAMADARKIFEAGERGGVVKVYAGPADAHSACAAPVMVLR